MSRLPRKYLQFLEDYPEVGEAYEAFGTAVGQAGPLDEKTRALVKLAISVGARLEGGAKSHAHKALQAGATPEEVRHVAILAAPTIGFPSMMGALSAVTEVVEEEQARG
mgnify:CR=1 FL=1